MFNTKIIILNLNIHCRSTVVKRDVFESVKIIYLKKKMTCQNEGFGIFGVFSTAISFDQVQNTFDINL